MAMIGHEALRHASAAIPAQEEPEIEEAGLGSQIVTTNVEV
jgi:hypothetical protein